MRKLICLLLLVSMALPLWGCASQEPPIEYPVTFYYRRSSLTYGKADSVIAPETRDAGNHNGDYTALIAMYLQGPADSALHRTFPGDVTVISLEVTGTSAAVQLSDEFSALSGLDLSIACACLTKTVCTMTGAERVSIYAENALLDGNKIISMTQNSLLLLDDSNIPIDPD